MKKLLTILLIGTFTFTLHAQKNTKRIPDILSVKHWAFIPKKVELTKSSMDKAETKRIELGDFYISKYEVTTDEYRRFLASLTEAEAKAHQPNNSGWEKLTDAKGKLIEYYQNHHGFDNYPVVNVTRKNAEAFAAWLTDEYNTQKKRRFKQVNFRLPTASEWELAARGDYPTHVVYPWGSPYMRTQDGKMRANILRLSAAMIKNSWDENGIQKIEIVDRDLKKNLILTSPIASYPETQHGLHDIIGNVSEMTISPHPERKGALISKGGSYALSEYWARVDSAYPLEGSNAFTGFRLIMEVIEK